MDGEYTAALRLFRGMSSEAFNDYIVRWMTAYIESWPVDAKPVAAPAPAAATNAATEGGSGGGEAADDDDGIVLKASDDEEETAPPATNLMATAGQLETRM
jgi:hypothetical protein